MSAQPCRVDTPDADAHEHHPHLTLVPKPARKMCKRCGVRPKKPGRGMLLCAECPPKPSPRSRPIKPCRGCGDVGPKHTYGSPYCADCAPVKAEVAAIKSRTRHAKLRQPCLDCGRKKPPGHGRQLCDSCLAKRHGDRVPLCSACGERPRRAKNKNYCQQCFDVGQRARRRRWREYTRAYRAKHGRPERSMKRQARQKEPPPLPKRIPCGQLAAAMQHIIDVHEAVEPHLIIAGRAPGYGSPTLGQGNERQKIVCDWAGVSDRSFRSWRNGERATCGLDVADRVLQRLELLWHDVWTPENTTPDEYRLVCEAMC